MDQYECATCQRTLTIEEDEHPLMCCRKPMDKETQREICLQPAHAAHARPMEDEDVCGEFHAGT
jgi:hypothetical protein